jgi:hypothetical protein
LSAGEFVVWLLRCCLLSITTCSLTVNSSLRLCSAEDASSLRDRNSPFVFTGFGVAVLSISLSVPFRFVSPVRRYLHSVQSGPVRG